MHPSLVLLFLHLWGNSGLSISQNECQKPEFPNGFIVGPDENKMYYYTCNEGYKLLTKGWWSAAKCNDSVWSELHQCIANTSCSLPDVPNGEVIPKQNSYEQDANVLIICKQGYRSEVNTLTCREGKWPELQQICTPITNSCPPPPKVKNAVVVTSYQKEYLDDSEVTYQCRQSYTTEGNNKITCKNGEWQNVDITCTNVDTSNTSCSLPDVPNGEVIPKQNSYEQGANVLIICKQGYRSEVGTLTCREGKWPEVQQICTPMTNTCPPPPKVKNAVVVTSYQKEYLHDSEVTYQCRQSYTIEGNNKITCKNGEWQNVDITCTNVTYKCRFTGVAESVAFTPRSARGHMFNRGQKLQFGCRMYGHVLHGNAEVVCSGNGQWSDPFPTCGPPSGCGKPPPLADGDTRFTSKYDYNHNDRVEYVCKNHYTMRGGPSKICNNGDWTGNITCLRPCTVDKEIMLKHNIAFLYSWEEKLYSPHQTSLSFRCTGRTRHVGTVSMRQQCIDGVISLPTCQ